MNRDHIRFSIYVGVAVVTGLAGISLAARLLHIEPSSSGTVIVSSDGRGQYTTISAAVQSSRPGMKILVRVGTYRESVVIDKAIDLVALPEESTFFTRGRKFLAKAVGVREDEKDVVIEGQNSSAVIMKTDDAVLRGFTLRTRNSSRSNARPFDSEFGVATVDIPVGRSTIEDCEITSALGVGIAIHGEGAEPVIRHSRIHDCCRIGIYVTDKARGTIDHCVIFNNCNVGISVTDSSAPSIEACDLYGNDYDVNITTGADPSLRKCTLRNGKTSALFIDVYGKGLIEDCDIYGHKAAQEVIVRGRSQPVIRRCKIHDSGHEGIIFYDQAEGLLEDSELYNNNNAGVIISGRSNPVVRKCHIHNMVRGGILVEGHSSGTIEECDIRNHPCMGILIIEDSEPTIRKCTITENGEGAIVVRQKGAGNVEDSDLRGNKAGGLLVASDSHVKSRRNRE